MSDRNRFGKGDPGGDGGRKKRSEECKQFWASLGISIGDWEDEEQAPPITPDDERDIRKLAQDFHSVPRRCAERILDLSFRFRSWAEACSRLGAEEFRKGNN